MDRANTGSEGSQRGGARDTSSCPEAPHLKRPPSRAHRAIRTLRHLNETARPICGAVERIVVRISKDVLASSGVRKVMTSNNALERTVNRGGRIVLAMNCVLADAKWRWWPAAQLDR